MTDESIEIESIITKFLNELTNIIYKDQQRRESLEEANAEYFYLKHNLLEALANSKVDFARLFKNLPQEKKEEHLTYLKRLFSSSEELSTVLTEINNLAILKEYDLIDKDAVSPQRESAIQALTLLEEKAKSYNSTIPYEENKQELIYLEAKDESIFDLASKFNKGLEEEITEFDLLKRIIEEVNLTDAEKEQLLTYIILENVKFYKASLERKNEELIEEIEESKQRVSDSLDSEITLKYTIPEEVLNELKRLLSDEETRRKISRLVNSNITFYNEEEEYLETEEDQQEALELAYDDIVSDLEEHPEKTPYTALQDFYTKNNSFFSEAKEFSSVLFNEDTPLSTKSEEEQEAIIRQGFEFYNSHKKLLSTITERERNHIINQMRHLYSDPSARVYMYQSKKGNIQNEVNKEAALEISVIINILKQLKEANCLTSDIISKASNRIEEIFTSINTVLEKEEQEEILPEPKSEEKGNIFFLTKSDSTSETFFEEDIGLNASKKELINYYDDIKKSLSKLEARDISTDNGIICSSIYKDLKEIGARFIDGGKRARIFFAPVGKKDSIIIGFSFKTGKEASQEIPNQRASKNIARIKALQEALSDPEKYQELLQANNDLKENILSLLQKSKIADDTIEEMTFVETPNKNEGKQHK